MMYSVSRCRGRGDCLHSWAYLVLVNGDAGSRRSKPVIVRNSALWTPGCYRRRVVLAVVRWLAVTSLAFLRRPRISSLLIPTTSHFSLSLPPTLHIATPLPANRFSSPPSNERGLQETARDGSSRQPDEEGCTLEFYRFWKDG